jgi:hypothetical protein
MDKQTLQALLDNVIDEIDFSDNSGSALLGTEGTIQLSEALKSNSSLTLLNLICNILAVIYSHFLQVPALILKEPSNYLKHSNQIHLSQNSFSVVIELLLRFVLTQCR